MRKIKERKRRIDVEYLPSSEIAEDLVKNIADTLAKQIDRKVFEKKYAPIKEILLFVGMGLFIGGSLIVPTLPMALKPFLRNPQENLAWKRFNIPYLKRTLRRLASQKLVEIDEEGKKQVVKITRSGSRRILKYALEDLEIKKPAFWDGKWRLISYDIPSSWKSQRNCFRSYLRDWGFYPFHESVFLHAYPCEKEITFLKEFLGIGEYVRIFKVEKIENDKIFKDFFGV